MAAGIKMKVMPTSPETDLEKLKENITNFLEQQEAKGIKYEEEPIAFGLKALMTFFEWPEDKKLDDVETGIKEIENVQSAEVIDMRKLG